MLDFSLVRRLFNRAAQFKDRPCFLENEVSRRLTNTLSTFSLQPRRLLQCGAASKGLMQSLSASYPKAALFTIDCAERRLLRFSYDPKLAVAVDYVTLPFKKNIFDIIISSLTLNWVSDLFVCLQSLKCLLKPNGLILFSLYGRDTLKELRESFIECQSYFYCFPDMHNVGDLLLNIGFERPVMSRETIDIRYKALNCLFQDLKCSGMVNAHQRRPKGLFGKSCWQRSLLRYPCLTVEERMYYPVTSEIIYGQAWKPALDHRCMKSESIIRYSGLAGG